MHHTREEEINVCLEKDTLAKHINHPLSYSVNWYLGNFTHGIKHEKGIYRIIEHLAGNAYTIQDISKMPGQTEAISAKMHNKDRIVKKEKLQGLAMLLGVEYNIYLENVAFTAER